MRDLHRLIAPGLRQRDGGPPTKPAFRVPFDFLGQSSDLSFAPDRHGERVHGNGQSVLVDIGADELVYLGQAELRRVSEAPPHGALRLAGGRRYLLSGNAEIIAGSQVSVMLLCCDDARKLDHASRQLKTGPFHLEVDVPPDATRGVVAFRVKGPACFAVHDLSLVETNDCFLREPPDPDRSVAMIALNDIVHRSRVVKTARALIADGFAVTLFGMWRSQRSKLTATSIAGAPALIFPNPTSFLRDAQVPALNWEHTVAFLRATMWHHIAQAKPRFIHTHDYHAAPLGLEFTRRLRALGHRVDWLHDFHEYVAGYEHMERDWQELILEREAEAVPVMDHRFTVSPLISSWLRARYQLAAAPTVVLNAPAKGALRVDFDRTVRGDLRLGDEVDLIVYSGGASEQRGLHTVVQALAFGPTWHFAVITNDNGPYTARLEQIATAGGFRDRLHFLPYVEPHQVRAYVRDASIGVMPFRRYGNTEAALPNKLFDYLHAGLPMAASNCTLIREFLETWQLGEVFAEEDVRDCARTIARVLSRQAVYRERIRRQPRLLEECTWEEQSKKILATYEDLAETSEPLRHAALG